MDIADVSKLANRKKLSSDVEKLREKVSRENRNIIKLKVAQDTAYWDVKEKLREVGTNHEKLQQNMVEVQMQYETISGQYQDELQFRPETLNKLMKTREICDVLEDYSERLRGTLSRCKADQASLYEAYQKSGQIVHELKEKQLRANEHNKLVIDNLQEKIAWTSSHNAQMLQFFNAERQRADAELSDAKARLVEANALKEEMMAAGREINRELEQTQLELQKKEEAIAGLQKDKNRMLKEFNSQVTDMKNTLLKQDYDLKESTSSIEALKQALNNQEAFTKSVVDEKAALLDKLASVEEEVANKDCFIRELQGTIQSANDTNDKLKKEIESLNGHKQDMHMQMLEKNELLTTMEAELQNLTDHLSAVENEKSDMECSVAAAAEQVKALVAKVEGITAAGADMAANILELQDKIKTDKEAFEKKLKQLNSLIEEKERNLNDKSCTISKLMSEVKNGFDIQTKMEATLNNTKKEMEAERATMKERERTLVEKIGQLDGIIKSKQDEFRRQEDEARQNMNVMMELRSEKERLNEKIVVMQNKIDNIQKELTGPGRIRVLTAAETDDNAVMLTPSRSAQLEPRNEPHFHAPRPAKPRPSQALLNFFSDSSMDGDSSLDPVIVNRRFEAMSRGEYISPVPLSALKKRRSETPASHPHRANDNIPLSQLQLSADNRKGRTFRHKRSDPKAKRNKTEDSRTHKE